MPLPPTRYIDAGPGVPLASPQVAMASGDAMARMGETIRMVGERGFEVAKKIRRIEEAGAVEAAFANYDEEVSQFSNGLMTRSDTSSWPTELREKMGSMRGNLKALNLSPEAQAAAEMRFDDWRSQRTIHLETIAANKAVELARGQISNSVAFHVGRRDWDAANQSLSTGMGSGVIDPVTGERARQNIAAQQARADLDDSIAADPAGMLEKLQDREKVMAEHPGLMADDLDWAKQQAARGLRDTVNRSADEFADLAAAGQLRTVADVTQRYQGKVPPQLRTVADVTQRYQGKVPPHILETFQQEMLKRLDHAEQERRATREYQAETAGRVASMLTGYEPNMQGFDSKLVTMKFAAESLPADSPVRDELIRQIGEVRDGKLAVIKDHAGAAQKALDEFYQVQFFSKLPKSSDSGEVMPTQKAINDGFLRNPQNLVALGWDKKAADKLAGVSWSMFGNPTLDPKKTDRQRAAEFKMQWEGRANPGAVPDDPMIAATAKAIVNGESQIVTEGRTGEDATARLRAERQLGDAKIRLAEWLKVNPKASAEQIDGKVREIGGEESHRILTSGIYDTSMNTNETSGRVTSYGYSGDSTPDRNSSAGIGAWVGDAEAARIRAGEDTPNKLQAGDLAVSPDVESELRKAGVRPTQKIQITTSKGEVVEGRWMDRTASEWNGKKLKGRFDVYSPDGPSPLNDQKVVSWKIL